MALKSSEVICTPSWHWQGSQNSLEAKYLKYTKDKISITIYFFYIKRREFWEIHTSLWYCLIHSLCCTLSSHYRFLQDFLQVVMNDPSADTRPEKCIALSVAVTTHRLFMPASTLCACRQLLWSQELIMKRWQVIDLSSENGLNFISTTRTLGYFARSELHGK